MCASILQKSSREKGDAMELLVAVYLRETCVKFFVWFSLTCIFCRRARSDASVRKILRIWVECGASGIRRRRGVVYS